MSLNRSKVIKPSLTLKEAPKDIKRLEILKPLSTPTMGERHNTALSKEKRLETLAKPVTKVTATQSQGDRKLSDTKGNPKSSTATTKTTSLTEQLFAKSKKNSNKSGEKDAPVVDEATAMDIEDEVKEGIDWSDEEKGEDDDEDSDDDSDDSSD